MRTGVSKQCPQNPRRIADLSISQDAVLLQGGIGSPASNVNRQAETSPARTMNGGHRARTDPLCVIEFRAGEIFLRSLKRVKKRVASRSLNQRSRLGPSDRAVPTPCICS